MNAAEKEMMKNPEHKPLMDLPPVIQHLMQANVGNLMRLMVDGVWVSLGKIDDTPLARGCIYAVNNSAPLTPPPPPVYKQYPVFCGSDRIYKVNMTQPNNDNTRIYHLHTVTGMAEFGGIRYEGSLEWRPMLDTVTWGRPAEVRFRVR